MGEEATLVVVHMGELERNCDRFQSKLIHVGCDEKAHFWVGVQFSMISFFNCFWSVEGLQQLSSWSLLEYKHFMLFLRRCLLTLCWFLQRRMNYHAVVLNHTLTHLIIWISVVRENRMSGEKINLPSLLLVLFHLARHSGQIASFRMQPSHTYMHVDIYL